MKNNLNKSTKRITKSIFNPYAFMYMHMFRLRYEEKIFDSVIKLVTIYMMNFFIAFKRSADFFRHYISMLPDTSTHISHGVSIIIYPFIAISRFSSTFPKMVFLTFELLKKAALTTSIYLFMSSNGTFLANSALNNKLALSTIVNLSIKCKFSRFVPDIIYFIKTFFNSFFDYHICILSGRRRNDN